MKIRKYCEANAEIRTKNSETRLWNNGKHIWTTSGPTNTTWYQTGRGAQAEAGFNRNTMVANVNGTWYVRYAGNAQRGQHMLSGGRWSTKVRKATKAERQALDAATQAS